METAPPGTTLCSNACSVKAVTLTLLSTPAQSNAIQETALKLSLLLQD